MGGAPDDDEVMLRGLVALIEAQAQQIDALKLAVRTLEGRVSLRAQVDVLLGHELRTPVSAVIGLLQSLQAGVDEEQRIEYLGRAIAQVRQLAETVEDLLSPPAEQGAQLARARMRAVPLEQLIDKAYHAVARELPRHRLELDVEPGVMVSTAPSRFLAIVVNLLQNAARYGGTDTIELIAGLDGGSRLVIEVADHGPGLRGVPVDVLFEAYSRGKHDGDVPGDGIGLYLVRMLARSLGGDVTLSEQDSSGVIARVELPQRRLDDPAAVHRAPALQPVSF